MRDALSKKKQKKKPKKVEIPFDPGIPLLGIYPKKTTFQIQKDICTPFFIAALFTIAKLWKLPKCPSVDESIKKRWNTKEQVSCVDRRDV